MGLADRAQPDAAAGPSAADRRALPLRRRRPSHAAAQPDPAGAAPARPDGAGRPGLPLLGHRPQRRADGRDAVRRWPASTPSTTTPASFRRRSCGSARSGSCSTPRPPARFIVGGWTMLVDALERHARSLGVQIVTGERVDALPNPPVIVALELCDARRLLGDDSLQWPSGQHRLPRPRAQQPPRRSVGRLRPRELRMDRALHRAGLLAGAAPASSSCRPRCRSGPASPPTTPRTRLEGLLDAVVRGLARARHLAPASGDGRAQRRARPAGRDVARPPRDRSRRRQSSCAATRSRRPAAWPRCRSPARSTPPRARSNTRRERPCAPWPNGLRCARCD